MIDAAMRFFLFVGFSASLACTTRPGSVGELSGGIGGSDGESDGTAGASSGTSVSESGDPDSGEDTTDTDGDGPKFDLGATTGDPMFECGEPEENPIYVLTRGTENGMPDTIHGFDPETLTFTEVLQVVCPDTTDWGVVSMAIDRHRRAWIQWGKGPEGPMYAYYVRLDVLDLDTGDCIPDQAEAPAARKLGMAFVTEDDTSPIEHLFFVDTSTNLYTLGGSESLGQYWEFQLGQGSEFSGVELTGTGEGRLFNLIMNWTGEWDHPCTADNPCYPTVHLGEVNKQDGSAISNVELPDVEALGISPGGFAFAHWGGRFWIFSSKNFGPTRVYDYDPTAHSTVVALEDGPDGVVGAGVSTCAPTIFPEG